MKNNLLFAVLILVFGSCEKDDSNTIDKSLLLGNWEKVEIELLNPCTDYLEIGTESYREKEICTGSSITSSFINYTLEGNEIKVDGKLVYRVEYLSSTLLKVVNEKNELFEYTKPLNNKQ